MKQRSAYQCRCCRRDRNRWASILYISNFYPTHFTKICLGWSWYLSVGAHARFSFPPHNILHTNPLHFKKKKPQTIPYCSEEFPELTFFFLGRNAALRACSDSHNSILVLQAARLVRPHLFPCSLLHSLTHYSLQAVPWAPHCGLCRYQLRARVRPQVGRHFPFRSQQLLRSELR